MDRLISLWHGVTVEQLVITLLMASVFVLFSMVKCLGREVRQLDKLSLLMAYQVDARMVKIHRNGDYQIVHPFNYPPTLDDEA